MRGLGTLLLLGSSLSTDIAPLPKYTPAERRHWAFQPRAEVAVPQFPGHAWGKNPIDAFLLARLEKEGLQPAPRASREILIRRVTYDLTGLPPTLAEIDAFLNDRSPNAWVKVVDRLLASPRYGEQWGRHWLDVVRFAETDGYEYDTHRTDAWRYRDWVITSFNHDVPYHDFLRAQLAGDEIAPDDEQMRIAAGFQRLGPLRKNAGNQEVASSRNEVLTEMTNAVGASLLGVTLGCARCHDHKFDPIRQSDYYRVQAYFAQVHEDDIPLSTPAEQEAWKQANAAWKAETDALRKQMEQLQGEQKALMERKLKDAEARQPAPLPALYSVHNDPAKITPIHLLARGEHTRPGARVQPRPLGVLSDDTLPELPADTRTPRTQLADWILQPQHPLTARVIVNRLWAYHFGRGIVATPNDFGRMGARPTHRELLDWLANDFVRGGWTLKRMHRQILLSNAYQQSGENPAMAQLGREKDPERTLLWAFPRRRLEAEEIRDSALLIAGRLNEKAGGPSVITPVEPELTQLLYKPSQWAVNPDPKEHDRRSVYLLVKRNLRLPFMEVFDAPDYTLSCPRREQSTHAPQALELLNGHLTNSMAAALAARLEKEKTPATRITLAYRLATGRAPSPKEIQLAQEFLRTQPLREFALAVFNLNAFLYVE